MNHPQQIPALLVELNISRWTARVLDKEVSNEVAANKGAKTTQAGNFNKHLLADIPQHKAISDFASKVRAAHIQRTLPWSDSGPRLLPIKSLFDYKEWIEDQEEEFNGLVDSLIVNYSTIVQAQRFKLGQLFDADLYPAAEELKGKYSFSVTYSPLPAVGDFRVDAFGELAEDMRKHYEDAFNDRLGAAMQDAWTRLHEELTGLSDKLSPRDDDPDKPRIFRDSLIPNAIRLCEALRALNVTNDPDLEGARAQLAAVLDGKISHVVREQPEQRHEIKAKVDDILSKFSFGG